RIPNHAHDPVFQIGHAVVIVDDNLVQRVVIQRIKCEVTAGGVLFLAAKQVVAQDATVFVRKLAVGGRSTECGGFDNFAPEHHMHQLETASDDACTPEQRADLLGCGVGGDVEVGGLEP